MTQTIIITGASSGIGKATATLFLDAGWNVALLARRFDRLQQLAKGRKGALACDVTKEAAVIGAFDKVVSQFGRIDVLFNNAGIFTPSATVDEVTLKDWQAQAGRCELNRIVSMCPPGFSDHENARATRWTDHQ